MHDWSEIYIAPGLAPADASFGVQKSDYPKIRDFYCGHQTVPHDLQPRLRPENSTAETTFRSEPLDFQRGEVEIDGKNVTSTIGITTCGIGAMGRNTSEMEILNDQTRMTNECPNSNDQFAMGHLSIRHSLVIRVWALVIPASSQ